MTDNDLDRILAEVATDDTPWTLLPTRFIDPLDLMAETDPDDPVVRQLLAVREQVRRQFAEIEASIPEGLSEPERGEYIAARALGSISAAAFPKEDS